MGLLLTVSEKCVPWFVRKRLLSELFESTAESFGVDCPSIRELSHRESLELYAESTRAWSSGALKSGDCSDIQRKLFEKAAVMGGRFRGMVHPRGDSEVMRLARVVYHHLDIDFKGNFHGDVVITKCLFSSYYSAQVCRLVSSLDQGLMAGLSGGGTLDFNARLTEGDGTCRAHLSFRGNNP